MNTRERLNVYVPLGMTVMTRGVAESISPAAMQLALYRHSHCDWGDVCDADWKSNNKALKNGTRLLSAYKDDEGTSFWVITEADRSSTTILFPSEY